jgi:hypothetical protein
MILTRSKKNLSLVTRFLTAVKREKHSSERESGDEREREGLGQPFMREEREREESEGGERGSERGSERGGRVNEPQL